MKKLIAAALVGVASVSVGAGSGFAAPALTRDDVRSMVDLRTAVPHLRGDEVQAFFSLASSFVGPTHYWRTLDAREPGQSFLFVHGSTCMMSHAGRSYELESEYGAFQDADITPVAFAFNHKMTKGYMLTINGAAGTLVGTRFVGGAGKFRQSGGAHDGFQWTSRGYRRVYLR